MAKTTMTATKRTGNGSADSKKKESFTYFAPTAENVELVGDFTGWEEKPITLKKQKDGTWKATVPLEPGTHEYRFKVDGQWQNDETCPKRRLNAFGQENCVREVS
jgi:1,4-alpha-glucan branching enzyme